MARPHVRHVITLYPLRKTEGGIRFVSGLMLMISQDYNFLKYLGSHGLLEQYSNVARDGADDVPFPGV